MSKILANIIMPAMGPAIKCFLLDFPSLPVSPQNVKVDLAIDCKIDWL